MSDELVVRPVTPDLDPSAIEAPAEKIPSAESEFSQRIGPETARTSMGL